MATKQNVVVVGAGGAGIKIVRSLSAKLDPSKFNLILVSSRSFYIHLVACLRMVVTDEGKLEDRVLIPFDKLFANGNGEFRIGIVTGVEAAGGGTDGSIILQSGERIPYRFLVLAPGSKWEGCLEFPNAKDETVAVVQSWRKKFADAQEIVIVGGGAVGIELAGELRDIYGGTKKKITLIHARQLLLNDTYPDSFRAKIAKDLELRNVTVILDDRIEKLPEGLTGSVKTTKGQEIYAELYISTRGGVPNTDFIRSLGDDVLTATGRVKIEPTLQLKSHPEIFAAGDVLDHPEQKQVGKYGGHASAIADNILALSEGKPATKVYKAMPEIIFVTNGKDAGWGYANVFCGLTVGNWLVKTLKSKGLFVDMTRKDLGITQ